MTNTTSNSKAAKDGKNKDLPPKPYTEYTIFFRLERTFLLQSTGIIDDEVVSSLDPNHQDPLEFPRPPRYQGLALPPYWYSSSHKKVIEKRRKHRKREGRMDLKTLSKTISVSWRNADKAIIEYCRMLARAETEKYNKIMDNFMAKEESVVGAAETVSNDVDVGPSSHQAFIMQPSQIQVAPSAPTPAPVSAVTLATTAPSYNNMVHQGNYGKVMGYGHINDAQVNNVNSAIFTMLKFRQLEAAMGTAEASDNSPNCVSSMSHYMGNNNHPLPVGANGISSGLSIPEKPERKRKLIRRVSAPPEFTRAHMGDICIPQSNPERELRRRVTMPSIPNPEALSQLCRPSMVSTMPPTTMNQLTGSFEDQLQHQGSFSCVPVWDKEDAETLLKVLNEPVEDLSLPQIGSSDFLLPEENQDMMQMFVEHQEFNDFLNVFEPCGTFT